MRREMTPAETALWGRLRARRLGGIRFRRQQVVDGFIADFYCNNAGVVVEVDGGVHDPRKEVDAERDAVIRGRDLLVLRFPNEQVIYDPDTVCSEIERHCRARAHPDED